MQIIEFTADSLRFLDVIPAQAPADGFVWVFLDRDDFEKHQASVQEASNTLGGSMLLDLHRQDLVNPMHPSHYDYTSVYDLIIFRRLSSQAEMSSDAAQETVISEQPAKSAGVPKLLRTAPLKALPDFERMGSKAVGFAVFDRLLISVHPRGCYTAKSFIARFLSDAKLSVDTLSTRSRIPLNPTDLVLRMINAMVDSYLELRKTLTSQLEHWQDELLKPNSRFTNWGAIMSARGQLHQLEDLCEGQHDAMQEWLDSLREQPVSSHSADPRLAQETRDQLVARARDVIEHIERVARHVHRLEQSAETVVQIHFSAQGNRTNDIMRTLTVLTAIFLPLNLITGFFGMNFEDFPMIHYVNGIWWTIAGMAGISAALVLFFWRKRYLARSGR